MADDMTAWADAPVYRCDELTKRRGLQCLRQAMHYDADEDMYRCQQHWEMHMIEQGFL